MIEKDPKTHSWSSTPTALVEKNNKKTVGSTHMNDSSLNNSHTLSDHYNIDMTTGVITEDVAHIP
jgi:hypothetical protein